MDPFFGEQATGLIGPTVIIRVRIDVPTHTYITALVCIIASLQGDSRLLAF